MAPIFARKDMPGFLSNLVTSPGVIVDTPDGCCTADGLAPYGLGSPQIEHQGATHSGMGQGHRGAKGKVLTVKS
jgi:hypothetical protein